MLKSFDEEADKLKANRERKFRPHSHVGNAGSVNGRTGLAG
jgi:hypothetical protein